VEYQLFANEVSDAMPINHVKKAEAFSSDELLKYIAISTDKPLHCQMYQLLNNWDARYLGKVMSCHLVGSIS